MPEVTRKRKNKIKSCSKIMKSGQNGSKWHICTIFVYVFVILMTKQCTKNNIFATGSVKKQGGPPTLSLKIQGGPPPFVSPKVAVPPCTP
jgi:hypothetical protein